MQRTYQHKIERRNTHKSELNFVWYRNIFVGLIVWIKPSLKMLVYIGSDMYKLRDTTRGEGFPEAEDLITDQIWED